MATAAIPAEEVLARLADVATSIGTDRTCSIIGS